MNYNIIIIDSVFWVYVIAMSSSIKISSDSESAGSFNFLLSSDEEAKPQVKKEKSSHYDDRRMRSEFE